MPKVRGPKDGKIITASFDGEAKSKFPSLKVAKNLVLLSISGNEFCSGEYLGAIVEQAVRTHQDVSPKKTPPASKKAAAPVGKTTFLIADEIYWHNLKDNTSSSNTEYSLKAQALTMGDTFFKDNLSYFLKPLEISVELFNSNHGNKTIDEQIDVINRLALSQGKNYEIVRWQTWVKQADKSKIEKILPLYSSVEGLQHAVNLAVEDFARRHGNEEVWNKRSRDYLTEESPLIMWLAASLGYNFVVYPGPILAPFAATKEFFVVEKHYPQIVKGLNVTDECTHDHSELRVHVDDPSQLVNWLEVNFKRGRELGAVNSKDNEFAFFSKAKTTKLHQQELMSEKKVSDVVVPNPSQTIISAVLQGIESAIANFGQGENQLKKYSSNEVAVVFEGISKGVLDLDLPVQEKMDLLVQLINVYTKTNFVSNKPIKLTESPIVNVPPSIITP